MNDAAYGGETGLRRGGGGEGVADVIGHGDVAPENDHLFVASQYIRRMWKR